ncbi:573cfcd8-60ea-49c9-8b18-4d28f1f833f0 [Thermothielavioides terrestris]|jgi:hypothetical protein|uniref:Fungal N-terminal domain-containing protein n=2 Tax=Thermothielavioides terrestris TaxID=2587410 RepID=G2QWP2_THETT|nr:uncharacterized protein THITE_2106220 [Thermothielavioides terrestris NRRL 8126]AEO62252.1 hypothetical protein THITE_2106220 [Thermothielavioides terrestris NRRL 8126]SPQ22279.1 573cfcd8-60ea-49c9-8b18-4d28f1f833f0 [Thermothielavioides terrestris]
MTDSSSGQWILVLSLTALLLSLAVLAQIVSRYALAYLDAPSEVSAFLDAVDSSIAENESYDRDIGKVQRLEDKLRLGRLLREIQRGGDDLREELNALLLGDDDPRLRVGARLCWASHRLRLEEKVRRLDLLRMRFLVVHMSIIAGVAAQQTAAKKDLGPRDPEKTEDAPLTPRPGGLPAALADSIKAKPPLRRLTVQAIGHQENVEGNHRKGWVGVVQELQRSPLLRERHASIELAMSRTP